MERSCHWSFRLYLPTETQLDLIKQSLDCFKPFIFDGLYEIRITESYSEEVVCGFLCFHTPKSKSFCHKIVPEAYWQMDQYYSRYYSSDVVMYSTLVDGPFPFGMYYPNPVEPLIGDFCYSEAYTIISKQWKALLRKRYLEYRALLDII